MKTNKRKFRIKVLEALFEKEFQSPFSKKLNPINKTVNCLLKHKNDIDKILKTHSQNWKIDRMALLDLNILRLGVYEMLYSNKKEAPKIFINEAIELAKMYGSKDSPKFVNGILDSVYKKEA